MNQEPQTAGGALPTDDIEAAERLHAGYERVRREIARVIVGQDDVLDLLLVALFARGHVILEGVPGLAKTLMVSSAARCLGLKFNRIQFMPDLMPADITGTEIIQEDRRTGSRSFRFLPGPVFANVLLADEVNRTPPKTQAALLEAMQERCVTVGGVRHEIDPPFFVLATQNPIEQEGTYPLPEAQQDRFMFKLFVDYPSYDEEYEIAERTTGADAPPLNEVLERDEILRLQELVRRVPVAPSIIRYTLDLVRLTRPYGGERAGMPMDLSGAGLESRAPQLKHDSVRSLELVNRLVLFGAGPRAVQFMLLGAKARAILKGRAHVATEDVQAMAHPVLRHRIITSYAAEAEGYDADRIIDHVLESHPSGTRNEAADAGVEQVFKA